MQHFSGVRVFQSVINTFRTNMKRLLFLFSFIFCSTILYAQKGSISGILLDSTNHQTTLNYATVSVFKDQDSILTTYKLSDQKGAFKVSGLQTDTKYRIVVNAWQYEVFRKEITITSDMPEVNLGRLFLAPQSNTVGEVVITAERPPIIVRKDTIEFNAESFKTLPTAVVEDLLKKLPGVDIASDGSIQVNGKSVSRILVDGKEFFGGDQQIATKNLPANIIDKIQVTDDQEAKRRDPDILAANTPQVINLKLKRAIKSGAFGKIYAGGGSRELYEGGGLMNIFRDTTQVSVLAYGNNVNKPGFSANDIMRIGGFSRSGVNSMSMNSEGSFSLNGISFGGPMGGGVQRSSGTGMNLNTLTKNGTTINGKYFFGYSNNFLNQLTDEEQTLGSGSMFSEKKSVQINRTYSHNAGLKIQAKLDSLTTLIIEPTVSVNLLRNSSSLRTFTRNSSLQLLNDANNGTMLDGNTADYKFFGNLYKDFKKTGRSLNVSANINQRNTFNDNFNNNASNFYNPNSTVFLDQLRDNNLRNFNVNLSAYYIEPIAKKLSLVVSTNANYIDNENALYTFFKNPNNQAYDIAVPSLSETVSQSGYKTNNRFNLRWKPNGDINIQPGIVFNTIDLSNRFNTNPNFEQHFQFFAPEIIIRYKSLNFSYSPSFREPDTRFIQPVANNTNPLFIQNGNPDLLPSTTHQVSLNLYKYDTKKTLSYNAYMGGSVQNNGVVMSRIINSNGSQVVTPVNEDGIWQFHLNGNISKDFKNNKRQFNVNTGFWSNYNRGIVIVNNLRSFTNNITFGPRIGGRINLNDKIELSETYSVTFNKSSYTDNFFTGLTNQTHSSDTELIIRFPKKMVWETTYRIQKNSTSIGGVNNDIKLWNAAVTMLFMKNDRLQLKLSVNDIVNTNIRRYLYINENMMIDTRTNNLGRHGLMTLTYNIQNFGGKVGGLDRMFRF